MKSIGFEEIRRHFAHSQSAYIVEFPESPLSVGEVAVKEIWEIKFNKGFLREISPTDCVKDRLCAYYFWNDLQALEQEVMVFKQNKFNVEEIERW